MAEQVQPIFEGIWCHYNWVKGPVERVMGHDYIWNLEGKLWWVTLAGWGRLLINGCFSSDFLVVGVLAGFLRGVYRVMSMGGLGVGSCWGLRPLDVRFLSFYNYMKFYHLKKVYGPNKRRGGKDFWIQIHATKRLWQDSWYIRGDFNVIILTEEKKTKS